MAICYVAFGGNLPSSAGHPAETMRNTIKMISKDVGRIISVSRFFATPCFPAGSGPDYVNGALAIEANQPPHALLSALHRIEHHFDRERTKRWGARTLDLDLLSYDDQILPDKAAWRQWHDLSLEKQMVESPSDLILPHPRVQERAFVLVPLNDIAPDWVHPVLGKTVGDMVQALDPALISEVKPL